MGSWTFRLVVWSAGRTSWYELLCLIPKLLIKLTPLFERLVLFFDERCSIIHFYIRHFSVSNLLYQVETLWWYIPNIPFNGLVFYAVLGIILLRRRLALGWGKRATCRRLLRDLDAWGRRGSQNWLDFNSQRPSWREILTTITLGTDWAIETPNMPFKPKTKTRMVQRTTVDLLQLYMGGMVSSKRKTLHHRFTCKNKLNRGRVVKEGVVKQRFGGIGIHLWHLIWSK